MAHTESKCRSGAWLARTSHPETPRDRSWEAILSAIASVVGRAADERGKVNRSRNILFSSSLYGAAPEVSGKLAWAAEALVPVPGQGMRPATVESGGRSSAP